MKQRLIQIGIAGIAVLLLLGGCVAHMPMSETVIFHDPATRYRHDARVGAGFAGTFSPTLPWVSQEAGRRFPDIAHRAHEVRVNPNRMSGGVYLSFFDEDGRVAFSTTLGILTAGVDMTAHLAERNYATLSYSMPDQFQAFLQHRVYNDPTFGFVAGAGYRRELFEFWSGNTWFSTHMLSVSSVGLRGYSVLRPAPGVTRGGLRFGDCTPATPLSTIARSYS